MPGRLASEMLWIICYDVSEDRRRLRVAEALEESGSRVQKSVFEVEASSGQIGRLRARLERLIDSTTDSVRSYPLCEGCRRRALAAGVDVERVVENFQVV